MKKKKQKKTQKNWELSLRIQPDFFVARKQIMYSIFYIYNVNITLFYTVLYSKILVFTLPRTANN